LTDRDPGVAVGDVITLTTGCTRCEVRVAHVAPLESAPTEGETAGMVFRVGLQRLRELAGSPDGQRTSSRVLAGCGRRAPIPLSTLVIGGSTMLIMAALVGAFAVLTNLDSPFVQTLICWEQGTSRPMRSPDQHLAQVTKELGLSKPQQTQIQDIAEKTVDALQAIDALWKNDPPEVRSHKQALLLEVAKHEIMRLLNEEQRARWKVLVE